MERFAGGPTQLTTQLLGKEEFGSGCPVAPAFYWMPPAGSKATEFDVLGRYTKGGLKGKVSLVRSRQHVFSGTPALPHTALREIARTAGVHIFLDSGGGMVDIMGDVLVVHAGLSSGPRQVVLPTLAQVEGENGDTLCSECAAFDTTMRNGSSSVYFLTLRRPDVTKEVIV